MQFIKKYWPEIIVIGIVFANLLNLNLPSITWMNTDSDGPHYILSAKYMQVAHNTSAPLYLLLGRLFLFIPIGTDAWRMGLISVFATTAGATFIYLIVRRLVADKPKVRIYAIISALVYGGSALVISQSTIIETYPLVTTLSLAAYLLCLKQRWVWASVVIGLIWATHTLFAWIIWLVLLVSYRQLRDITLIIITLAFLVFYAYIPIVTAIHDDPAMWGNTSFSGFVGGNFGVLTMLAGALSIWDMPKRILDTLAMLGVSLGLGLVVITWYFYKMKTWRNNLLWLFLLPVIWFVTNLSAETYVYMLPAIAFGSVAVGVGLSRMNVAWAWATCAVAIILLGYNAVYFDIGRTLDPEMSTVKFYEEELVKIPDGDIFIGGGWTWAIVYLYNKEEGRNIIPICYDIFPSDKYLSILEEQGIKLKRSDAESHITLTGEVSLSIVELNEGVWIAKETKPEVYQYVIEPGKGNEAYIGRWIGQEVEPEWRWKPSNPYKFITGQLEVAEWHHILRTNHNAIFAISFGIYGLGIYWIILKLVAKRKKHKVR